MRMTYISCSLEFEQNLHPFTRWKKNCINISDVIVLLSLLLSQFLPMLIFVHLMNHLYLIFFKELTVWIMYGKFVCLPLICLVLNWDGHEVDVSWNYWYLNRI